MTVTEQQTTPVVEIKSAPKRSGGKAKAAPKATKPTARDQGVPEQYLSESGKFRPGADATYKRDLIAVALDESKPKAERTKAEKQLAAMGWTKFLEASRASRTKKAAAKAAKKESKGRVDSAKTE